MKTFNIKKTAREGKRALYIWCTIYFTLIVGLVASCSTQKTVTQTITVHDTLKLVRIDTLRQWKTIQDSIYLRDSIYMQGETLIKERTKDRWHIRTDTVWRMRIDTVRIAVHSSDIRRQKERKTGSWWSFVLGEFITVTALSVAVFLILHRIFRR